MNKCLYLLLVLFIAIGDEICAQVNITVAPDSVHVTQPVEEFEIDLPSQITNNAGGPVTIRWTRVVEQKPVEWDYNFCDKNLCYLGIVESKTFDLTQGESGLLKPIFYPNNVAGTGVFRLYLQSETPGVIWADTAVFVGVAADPTGTIEAELVRSVSVFPNPATEVLNVVTADAQLQGQWRITDSAGKVWCFSGQDAGPIAGQIPVAHLPSGLYLLNVLTTDGKHAIAKRFAVHR